MFIGPWSAIFAAIGARVLSKHPNWIPGVVWVLSTVYEAQGMDTDERAEYLAGMVRELPIEG